MAPRTPPGSSIPVRDAPVDTFHDHPSQSASPDKFAAILRWHRFETNKLSHPAPAHGRHPQSCPECAHPAAAEKPYSPNPLPAQPLLRSRTSRAAQNPASGILAPHPTLDTSRLLKL